MIGSSYEDGLPDNKGPDSMQPFSLVAPRPRKVLRIEHPCSRAQIPSDCHSAPATPPTAGPPMSAEQQLLHGNPPTSGIFAAVPVHFGHPTGTALSMMERQQFMFDMRSLQGSRVPLFFPPEEQWVIHPPLPRLTMPPEYLEWTLEQLLKDGSGPELLLSLSALHQACATKLKLQLPEPDAFVSLLQAAAQHDFPHAQYFLGCLSESGKLANSKMAPAAAMGWFSRAAQHGLEAAASKLEELSRQVAYKGKGKDAGKMKAEAKSFVPGTPFSVNNPLFEDAQTSRPAMQLVEAAKLSFTNITDVIEEKDSGSKISAFDSCPAGGGAHPELSGAAVQTSHTPEEGPQRLEGSDRAEVADAQPANQDFQLHWLLGPGWAPLSAKEAAINNEAGVIDKMDSPRLDFVMDGVPIVLPPSHPYRDPDSESVKEAWASANRNSENDQDLCASPTQADPQLQAAVADSGGQTGRGAADTASQEASKTDKADIDPDYGLHRLILAQLSEQAKMELRAAKERVEKSKSRASPRRATPLEMPRENGHPKPQSEASSSSAPQQNLTGRDKTDQSTAAAALAAGKLGTSAPPSERDPSAEPGSVAVTPSPRLVSVEGHNGPLSAGKAEQFPESINSIEEAEAAAPQASPELVDEPLPGSSERQKKPLAANSMVTNDELQTKKHHTETVKTDAASLQVQQSEAGNALEGAGESTPALSAGGADKFLSPYFLSAMLTTALQSNNEDPSQADSCSDICQELGKEHIEAGPRDAKSNSECACPPNLPLKIKAAAFADSLSEQGGLQGQSIASTSEGSLSASEKNLGLAGATIELDRNFAAEQGGDRAAGKGSVPTEVDASLQQDKTSSLIAAAKVSEGNAKAAASVQRDADLPEASENPQSPSLPGSLTCWLGTDPESPAPSPSSGHQESATITGAAASGSIHSMLVQPSEEGKGQTAADIQQLFGGTAAAGAGMSVKRSPSVAYRGAEQAGSYEQQHHHSAPWQASVNIGQETAHSASLPGVKLDDAASDESGGSATHQAGGEEARGLPARAASRASWSSSASAGETELQIRPRTAWKGNVLRNSVRIPLAPPTGDPGSLNFAARRGSLSVAGHGTEQAELHQQQQVSSHVSLPPGFEQGASQLSSTVKALHNAQPAGNSTSGLQLNASNMQTMQPARSATQEPDPSDDLLALLLGSGAKSEIPTTVRQASESSDLRDSNASPPPSLSATQEKNKAAADKPGKMVDYIDDLLAGELVQRKHDAAGIAFIDVFFPPSPSQPRDHGFQAAKDPPVPGSMQSLGRRGMALEEPGPQATKRTIEAPARAASPATVSSSSSLSMSLGQAPRLAGTATPLQPNPSIAHKQKVKFKRDTTSVWDDIFSPVSREQQLDAAATIAGPAALQSAAKRGLLLAREQERARVPNGTHIDSGYAPAPPMAVSTSIQKYLRLLTCPLTHELMTDPVVAYNGRTYDRTAIEHHFRTVGTIPETGMPMNTVLQPNTAAKKLLQLVLEQLNAS